MKGGMQIFCLTENMLRLLSLLTADLTLDQALMTILTTMVLALQCVLCIGTKNYIRNAVLIYFLVILLDPTTCYLTRFGKHCSRCFLA
jgi:hypothetical protein